MSGEWIRADLPDRYDLQRLKSGIVQPFFFDDILDAVVEHLNANHQKPTPGLLSNAADCVLGAEDRVSAAKSDADRWRRAHEIVEGERDQAREQWKKWEYKANEADREVSTWRTSTESAHSDFLQAAHDRDEWQNRAEVAEGAVDSLERDRDEWRSRAEAAETRTATAVSRADVAETLSRCLNPEMWNVTFPSVVSEVCDLFGVEAGQAVDPLLDKAQEFAALADWELTDREAELLHTVAAHVLGQEVK